MNLIFRFGAPLFSVAAGRIRGLLPVRCPLAATMFLTLACNAKPMTLSWQDTSENEEGFRIYRVADNKKQFIAQVGPNVTQYVDKDAPAGACYIVTAFNAAGESPSTNSACKEP